MGTWHRGILQEALTCSEGLSYEDSLPLVVESGTDVTIVCPVRNRVRLFSNLGKFQVARESTLTFEGCDVETVASPGAAASAPMPPDHLAGYFGDAAGATVRFKNSRLLMPSEVLSHSTALCKPAPCCVSRPNLAMC